MPDQEEANLTGAIALISGITRGLFDPWLDSIALVAIRRRNAIKRRYVRLNKEQHMDDDTVVERDQAYRQIRSDLADSLEAAGSGALSTIPLKELGAVYWNLSIMTGLLETELARRDGTTDMAQL